MGKGCLAAGLLVPLVDLAGALTNVLTWEDAEDLAELEERLKKPILICFMCKCATMLKIVIGKAALYMVSWCQVADLAIDSSGWGNEKFRR